MNRTHRITLALSIALFAITLVVMFAKGAQAVEGHYADSRPCMSKGEWHRLREGQTRAEVEAILDGPGKGSPRTRTYEVCNTKPGDALLAIRYVNGAAWGLYLFDFTEVNS